MKKVFFTLIFAIFFVGDALAEGDISRYVDDCLSVIDKPRVKVKSSYGYLKYDYTKDTDYLTRLSTKNWKKNGKYIPEDFSVGGLAVAQMNSDFSMDVSSIVVSDGKYCVYPVMFNAYVGYSVPKIYISKDLKKGTCGYDLAVRHENTHMEIYLLALEHFMPKFKDIVNGLLDEVGVSIVDNKNEVEEEAKKLSLKYHEYVKAKVDEWWNDVEEEQWMMDRPDNYDLEHRICRELEDKK